MKRIIPFLLITAFLFVGCADDKAVSNSLSEPVAEVKMLADMSFQISGYDGLPKEFLLNNYQRPIYFNGSPMEALLDTPLTLYINESGNNVFVGYDKLSGVFYNTCDDEKGVHESCVWTSYGKTVFGGIDRMFFVFHEDEESVIYSSDFYGENKKKLYRSDYSVQKVVQEGEYIYFLESGIIDGETADNIYRLNLADSTIELLLSQKDIYYFMPMNGKLLYSSPTDNNYYIFNPKDKSSKLYADSAMLPIAFYKNSMYFEHEGFICRRDDSGVGKTEYLFEGDYSSMFFTENYIYRYVYNDGVYKHDYEFSINEPIYSLKDYPRTSVCSVSEEALIFRYTLGENSGRETHIVIVDLKTKELFDAVIS